jgi:hypothetical protein
MATRPNAATAGAQSVAAATAIARLVIRGRRGLVDIEEPCCAVKKAGGPTCARPSPGAL